MSRFLIVLSLLLSFEAVAQQESDAPPFRYGYKDWLLKEESVDPYLGVPSCRAYTTRVSPEAAVQLSLSFPMDYLRAPVAMISLGSSLVGQKLEIRLISEGTELALPLEHLTNSEGTTYWYIPMAMDEFIYTINHAETLDIVVLTESKMEDLKISLAGSLRTLQVATKCLGQADLYIGDFFKELNDPSVKPLPVDGEISSRKLQELFQMSYAFFASLRKVKADLESLAEENKDVLAKESLAQQRYTQASEDLLGVQKTLKDQENEAVQLKEFVASSKVELGKIKKQVKRAEDELSRVTEKLTPLQDRMDEFQQKISRERSKIDVLNGHIRYESGIVTHSTESVARLEEELKERATKIQSLKTELAGHQADRSRSEQELNALNVEQEAGQRLERNSRYQEAGLQIQQLRGQLAPLKERMRQAQGVQIESQREFESCRRENLQKEVADSCTSEIDQLQKAQSEFSLRQREVRGVNSRIAGLEAEISQLRQSIRQNVLSERDRILSRFNAAKQNVSRVESLIKNYEDRIQHINEFELPHLKEQISTSGSKLRNLKSQESEAQSHLIALQTAMERFRISSGFEQTRRELSMAQEALRNAEFRLEDLEGRIVQSEKRLAEISSGKSQLKASIAERSANLAQAKSELAAVQTGLEGYRTVEAQLKETLELLTRQYNESRGHYRFLYSELAD